MSEMKLEQRVAALEQKVADLEVALAKGGRKRDWRRTMGMFSGDDVMKEIFDEALKYREHDREKARHRFARSEQRKTKKTKRA